MKEWMTKNDLAEYIQISETKINLLVRNKTIPFYDNHGFLRFNKSEIDEWMKSPGETKSETDEMNNDFYYRGRPITKYKLSASRVLSGDQVWTRLQEFICKAMDKVNSINGRNYLFREDFKDLNKNFSDYLGLSCQLGLIDSEKGKGRIKHYYFSDYSVKIHAVASLTETRKIILESVFDIVKKSKESLPAERHSIYLLWYYLSLKNKYLKPAEYHFRRTEAERNNYFPLVRLSFSQSFCRFLFASNEKEEQDYLDKWNLTI